MHENTSSRTAVLIGFYLCILFSLVIAVCAYYSIRMIERAVDRLDGSMDADRSFQRALRCFDDAKLDSARFQETDGRFEERVREQIQTAVKELDEARNRTYHAESQKLGDTLSHLYRDFESLFHREVEITRKPDADQAWKTTWESTFILLDKLEQPHKQGNADLPTKEDSSADRLRSIRSGLYKLEIFRHERLSGDEMQRTVALKENREQLMRIAALLKELFDRSVTQERKQTALELERQFEDLNRLADDWARRDEERWALREKMDRIAFETEDVADMLDKHQTESGEMVRAELSALIHMSTNMILISAIVMVVAGVFISLVVVRILNRGAVTEHGGFSDTPPGADLQTIADKLQEVVDLLRR